MFALTHVYLLLTFLDTRVWSLTFLGSFSVRSFFNAIFALTNSVPVILVNFIANPKLHLRVFYGLW